MTKAKYRIIGEGSGAQRVEEFTKQCGAQVVFVYVWSMAECSEWWGESGGENPLYAHFKCAPFELAA